jgi:polar amino acid transport system substrate-binding protein
MDPKTSRFRRKGRPLLTIALGVLAAICITSPDARGQTAQLHLVSTAWPPFTNPAGQPRFALDLVEEALKRIGSSADTEIVADANFTTSLLSGTFDGSAAAWRDTEREKVLVYSEPYLENRLLLVGRRGSDVSAPKLSSLAGKRIALVGGYSYGDEANGSGAVFIRSRSEEDSLAKLLANEADYTLMDELVVQYILQNYGEQARSRISVGSLPLVTRTLHLAIRRSRPGAEALVNRFNAEIRKMIADRTYHRLLHVDWIEADVDGDGRKEVVARSDQAGPNPPERTYNLLSTTATTAPQVEVTAPPPPAEKRFYFGGSIYENWASVPQNYKLSNSDAPDPSRSTATLFSFRW